MIPLPVKKMKASRLPVFTKSFLVILTLCTVAGSLSMIFVHVFLFKISRNMYDVSLFNFLSYLIWAPSFVVAGIISKKIERKYCLIIGCLFQQFFYGTVFFLETDSVRYLVVLSALFGIGSGFFWLSVNALTVDYTTRRNRAWFNSLNGIWGSLSQMIGPLAGGWIVDILPAYLGYRIIFGASLVLFTAAIVFAFFLPGTNERGRFSWHLVARIHGEKEWRNLTYSFLCLSFRDGVISFVIAVWIYIETGSEGVLGNFTFLTTVLSAVTYYLIGRFQRKGRNWSLIVWGNLFLSLSISGLAVHVNLLTLVIYGIVSAVCMPMFTVPFDTLSMDSISRNDRSGKRRIEMVVARELALSVGRVSSVGGLTLVYTFTDPAAVLPVFLIVLLGTGSLSVLFIRKYRENV